MWINSLIKIRMIHHLRTLNWETPREYLTRMQSRSVQDCTQAFDCHRMPHWLVWYPVMSFRSACGQMSTEEQLDVILQSKHYALSTGARMEGGGGIDSPSIEYLSAALNWHSPKGRNKVIALRRGWSLIFICLSPLLSCSFSKHFLSAGYLSTSNALLEGMGDNSN